MTFLIPFLSILLSDWARSIGSGPSFLTRNDLKQAEMFFDHRKVDVFGGHRSFWICVSMKDSDLEVKCDDLGINELEGPKAELQISLRQGRYSHFFGLRHGISLRQCIGKREKLRGYVHHANALCVSGDAAGINDVNGTNRVQLKWVLNEVKSERGGFCELCGEEP